MEAAPVGALVALAVVGSFTPGPNTTIATVTGVHFGFRAVLPHLAGVPVGFSTLLALGSLGVAGVLLAAPAAAALVKWAGVGYLLYLGARLLRPARPGHAALARPFTFAQSVLFQYANPKAWMLAAATAGAAAPGPGLAARTALVCALFSAACIVSLAAWAWLGASLRQWLGTGHRLRAFDAAMALSLVATALWMAATS
jgi:threonine/homoserine/homoserine lactone efflux protein